jgi:hypothetical protein
MRIDHYSIYVYTVRVIVFEKHRSEICTKTKPAHLGPLLSSGCLQFFCSTVKFVKCSSKSQQNALLSIIMAYELNHGATSIIASNP